MDAITLLITTVSLILFIVIPGFLLSLAIFPPERRHIDNIERVGISLVLGLTPQFILYFADKNMLIPINTATTYLSILIISLVGLGMWLIRRGSNSVA